MSSLKAFTLFSLAVGMLSGHACAEEAFVRLRQHVSLDSVVVQLGDVAEITTGLPETTARLRAIEIARLKSLVKPVRLARAEVDALLARQRGFSRGSIAWGGSSEVVISGRLGHVDLTPGLDAAAKLLMEKYGQRRGVVIRVVDGGGEVLAPPGPVNIRPEMASLRRLGRSIELPLVVEVDGVRVARPQIRFEISWDTFDSPMPEVVLRKSSVLELPPDLSARAPGIDVRRPVGALDDGDLLIKKDQSVRILVEAGAVRLESDGIALADARHGDMVKVKRSSGNNEIPARVIGRGLVLVGER